MNHSNKSLRIGYIIFALGAIFYCYEYFLRIAPAVMQDQLMQTFHINATLFGTLSAFYFYAYTPMQLFVGLAVDRFSVRKVLIVAIFACAFGSFLMGNTNTYWVAGAGRFLQGFGSAFAFVGALKLTSVWLRADRFAFYAGMVNMLGFLGAAVGTVSTNILVERIGWHMTIQYFTILGVILIAAVWLTTRKAPAAKSNQTGSSAKTASLKESLGQLWQVVRIPGMWFSGIFAGFLFLPTSVFAALWGVPYLEKLHNYSADQASLATSMIFVGWAIGAFATGWISDLIGARTPIMRVGTLCALLLSLPLLYYAAMPFYMVCFCFVLFGAFSSAQALSFVIAKDLSPSASAVGTAVAFINTITMLGGMIFQRGLGQILDWSWSGTMVRGIPYYTLHDYEVAITIVPISLALGLVISFFMRDSLPHGDGIVSDVELEAGSKQFKKMQS